MNTRLICSPHEDRAADELRAAIRADRAANPPVGSPEYRRMIQRQARTNAIWALAAAPVVLFLIGAVLAIGGGQ